MPGLFDPVDLGAIRLPNRIVMAPMSRSRADAQGVPTALVADYYGQRATAGLIIGESTYVSDFSRGYADTPGLVTMAQVAGGRAVTGAVHAKGGRIVAQLYHMGRVTMPETIPGGALPLAPSAIAIAGMKQTPQGKRPFAVPQAMQRNQIRDVVDEFAQAARRAIDAGFDGIELHAASGFLIQQFLDPASTFRSDEYGGSVGNRLRFLLELVEAVSAIAGAERTAVKFSPRIAFNGMVEPDADTLYPLAARELSARHIAFLHVAVQPGYAAGELRDHFAGPFLIGTGLDRAAAQAIIASGRADAAVFGRPVIANPDLVRRFAEGLEVASADPETFYTGGARGYTDYPPHP